MLAVMGVIALISAASMLVLRQPMRVAIALISTMSSLGAIYGLLGAHFLAAFQVLLYVGAVMVFMVYVIMLLEVREGPNSPRASRWAIPGVALLLVLTGVLGITFLNAGLPSGTLVGARPFSISEFAAVFLRDYWLEFELTTVYLVAAIVAALAVIRVSRRSHG
ncbi:MAG: NADH-quinone oxidoreductase subunit J [Gemmatimonadaceae bacterium]|jgi:NADH-quinone oxidoreductase subunit J